MTDANIIRIGGAITGNPRRTLAAALGLALLLTAPLARATPSASCCFTGSVWTCIDEPMVDTICDYDPYCCQVMWDDYCAEEYEAEYDWTCPPLFRGVYTTAGAVEVSEFGSVTCGGADSDECQWSDYFGLPANRTAGSTAMVNLYPEVQCTDMAGAGGDYGLVQIFSNINGVIRGAVVADWFFDDLNGACTEPIQALRFQITPKTTKGCFTSSTAPGCNEPRVQLCVCHNDPFCCQTAWDSMCVAEAHDCNNW